MSDSRLRFKIIKAGDKPKPDPSGYMTRHEQSLLEILIERNPERARVIVQRMLNKREQEKAA